MLKKFNYFIQLLHFNKSNDNKNTINKGVNQNLKYYESRWQKSWI